MKNLEQLSVNSNLENDSDRLRYIIVQKSNGKDMIYDRKHGVYKDPRTNEVFYFLE